MKYLLMSFLAAVGFPILLLVSFLGGAFLFITILAAL